MKRKIMATVAAAVLAAGIAVAANPSPAFAATCQARVNYGTSGSTGSATEFNGQSQGAACALVRVRISSYLGGGISSNTWGPQSNASSYASAYGVISFGWYSNAMPSTIWSEQQWLTNNTWKTFAG